MHAEAFWLTCTFGFYTMPQRKHVHDQGGSTQKAKRARELAQSEVPADVVVVDAVQALDKSVTLDSQAAWHWLQQWSWGKMSSTEVQQEALNNYKDYQRMLYTIPLTDGWIPRSIHQLAQFGSWGATLATLTGISNIGLVSQPSQSQWWSQCPW